MLTPPFVAFVLALVATGAMRLGELVVSFLRWRRRPGAVIAEPWLFPVMALLHVGLVVLPIAEVLVRHIAFQPLVGGFALFLLLSATGLRIWTLRTIGGAWNVRVVVPEADAIASDGPYEWIRHPNYLVVIIEIIALPMLHSAKYSMIALSLLNAFVLFFRIRTEERVLMNIPEWKQAMGMKARFIPGVF